MRHKLLVAKIAFHIAEKYLSILTAQKSDKTTEPSCDSFRIRALTIAALTTSKLVDDDGSIVVREASPTAQCTAIT